MYDPLLESARKLLYEICQRSGRQFDVNAGPTHVYYSLATCVQTAGHSYEDRGRPPWPLVAKKRKETDSDEQEDRDGRGTEPDRGPGESIAVASNHPLSGGAT